MRNSLGSLARMRMRMRFQVRVRVRVLVGQVSSVSRLWYRGESEIFIPRVFNVSHACYVQYFQWAAFGLTQAASLSRIPQPVNHNQRERDSKFPRIPNEPN